MGSQYIVHERDGFQVCLNEGSSRLSLMLKAGDEVSDNHIRAWPALGRMGHLSTAAAYANHDMQPAEVVAMAVEMIKVATYWSCEPRALVSQVLDGLAPVDERHIDNEDDEPRG